MKPRSLTWWPRPLTLLLLAAATSAAACSDDGATPDATVTRPADAAVDATEPDAAVDATELDARPSFDLTGPALLAVQPNVNGSGLVRWQATIVVHPDVAPTGTLDISAVALDVDTDEEVGAPLVANGVAIAADNTFAIHLVGTLPGAANPILEQDFDVDATLTGTILDDDSACGTVTGNVGQLDLAGSTFGLVRVLIDKGLPEPLSACPPAP